MKVTGPQYHSPAVHYDQLAQVVIIQRVDPDTGEVTSQEPRQETVTQQRIAALGAAAPAAAAAESAKSGPAPEASARPAAPVAPPRPSAETQEAPAVHPQVSLLV
jgi:hypothetical protein